MDRLTTAPKLAGEEREVESNVVPDDDAPAHQLDHAGQDVGEQRLPDNHLVRNARERHDPRPDAALRIHELLILRDAPPALDPADADLDHAMPEIGRCAGGLDVHERERDFTQLVNQGYAQVVLRHQLMNGD